MATFQKKLVSGHFPIWQSIWMFIKRIFITIAIGYGLVLSIMYWRQETMLFPRPHEQATLQTVAGLITTSVKTSDGETLPALYLEAKAGNPTILFFHGNGGQINTSTYLAELFAARGLGFAAVEYRGYPGATGTTSEVGIMTDGLIAFDWVKSKCRCEII